MFQAVGVSKSFGPTRALEDVSFFVEAGEVCALAGENGSGKSTLMRIMHGELSPESGVMTLEGEAYAPSSPRSAMAAGVTLIHQELAISDHLTVAENIFLGAEVSRGGVLDARQMESAAADCLARLGQCEISPRALASTLSQAQKQTVEIARALRTNSKVILLDEPTSSLGRSECQRVFDTVRELKAQGIAIVYITHFLDEMKEVCDRVVVLRDGRNVGEAFMGQISTGEIAAMMAGQELSMVFPRSPREPGEALLEAQAVSGKKKPTGANVTLRAGEVVGIAGLNGAGRTETARCLFGLDKLKVGAVTIRDSTCRMPAWNLGAGFVSEDRKGEGLALGLTLDENLTLSHLGTAILSSKQTEARTRAVIDRFGVKCQSVRQPIASLSGGNQQKIAIGRLADADCQVLILDEPTRGIDVRSKSVIYQFIDESASQGKAVLLVSSQFSELCGLCDRIYVMRRGEIVAEVDGRTATEHSLLEVCAGS